MYVDIVISNVFNFNNFFFSYNVTYVNTPGAEGRRGRRVLHSAIIIDLLKWVQTITHYKLNKQ